MAKKPNEQVQQPESKSTLAPFDRRQFLASAAVGAAAMALPNWAWTGENNGTDSGLLAFQDDLSPIRAEITKRHDETVQRMQTWMRQSSIAAKNRGMNKDAN